MFILVIVTILNFIQTDAAFLRFYNSSEDYIVTPLTRPLPILNSSYFDINRKTVIYTFGYSVTVNFTAPIAIKDAYVNNVDVNFILLDWAKEASIGKLGFVLSYPISAVPNSKKVGLQLGDAILELVGAGLNIETLHLVGHSLGAHLMAYASNRIREAGKVIRRITGLDPAGPLFSGPFSLRGLQPTSASFVAGIHTEPGTYGTAESVGQVDIWVNCGLREQPGCANLTNLPFSRSDTICKLSRTIRTQIARTVTAAHDAVVKYLCSHDRAQFIFAESIANPEAFPAIQYPSCFDWRNSLNRNGNVIFIKEEIDAGARGRFYLRTASREPYGLGLRGLRP